MTDELAGDAMEPVSDALFFSVNRRNAATSSAVQINEMRKEKYKEKGCKVRRDVIFPVLMTKKRNAPESREAPEQTSRVAGELTERYRTSW